VSTRFMCCISIYFSVVDVLDRWILWLPSAVAF
jgi:hypothetical protein